MITLIYILSSTTLLGLVFSILWFKNRYKYITEVEKLSKLRKNVQYMLEKKREGYYNELIRGDDVRIYVSEIERYKNNKSKIKLISFETDSHYRSSIKYHLDNSWISVRDTNTIIWLEPDDRVKKLERILNIENDEKI